MSTAVWPKMPDPEAERVSLALLRKHDVRAPGEIHLERLSERENAYVVAKRPGNVTARLIHGLVDQALIYVDPDGAKTPRGRFSLAHELLHWLLKHGADLLEACSGSDPARGSRFKAEHAADDGAATLLMPGYLAADHCGAAQPTFDHVFEFAESFTVSAAAAGLRYVQLASAPCAVACVRHGVVRWWNASAAFPVRLARRFELGPGAHAASPESLERHVREGKPQLAPGFAWSPDKKRARPLSFLEHAVPIAGTEDTLVWLVPA